MILCAIITWAALRATTPGIIISNVPSVVGGSMEKIKMVGRRDARMKEQRMLRIFLQYAGRLSNYGV